MSNKTKQNKGAAKQRKAERLASVGSYYGIKSTKGTLADGTEITRHNTKPLHQIYKQPLTPAQELLKATLAIPYEVTCKQLNLRG
jgi:hypothetical protein